MNYGATYQCYETSGTSPGIITDDCTDTGADGSSTYTSSASSSNAVLRTGIDMVNSFKGKITSDDAANTSDASGSSTFTTITDWFSFDNWYRIWGKNGVIDNDNSREDCASGETCQIWDFRVTTSDTVIRNRSNDGNNANATFANNSTCPAAVHGNKTLTDQQTTSNTFLINALEIRGDAVGDDDGLCESNESCIYSPNFGVYQVSGDYTSQSCIFQDGTVSGVKMYAYPTNGI